MPYAIERLDSTPVINNFLPVRKPMELSCEKTRQNCRMRALLLLLACVLSPAAWAAHGYALWGDLKYPPGFASFSYVNPQAPRGGELRLVSNPRGFTVDK